MGGMFGGAKMPAEDPELVRQRQEAEARAKQEKADREAAEREERLARERGQRGRSAFTTNGLIGYVQGQETIG